MDIIELSFNMFIFNYLLLKILLSSYYSIKCHFFIQIFHVQHPIHYLVIIYTNRLFFNRFFRLNTKFYIIFCKNAAIWYCWYWWLWRLYKNLTLLIIFILYIIGLNSWRINLCSSNSNRLILNPICPCSMNTISRIKCLFPLCSSIWYSLIFIIILFIFFNWWFYHIFILAWLYCITSVIGFIISTRWTLISNLIGIISIICRSCSCCVSHSIF